MTHSLQKNQLTLGVGLRDDATFANYFCPTNEPIVDSLSAAIQGQGEKFIFLVGKGGVGCTHLLQACCHSAFQMQKQALYLPLENLHELSTDILEDIEYLDVICIDDLHMLIGKPNWEQALFHAYNRIRDNHKTFIVTANTVPTQLKLSLPDMISRLSWGLTFTLPKLDDNQKLRLLIMRAECRGLMLNEEVAKFLLNHCPRHMSTLFAALDALDKASLVAHRKLTIPFVKDILQI